MAPHAENPAYPGPREAEIHDEAAEAEATFWGGGGSVALCEQGNDGEGEGVGPPRHVSGDLKGGLEARWPCGASASTGSVRASQSSVSMSQTLEEDCDAAQAQSFCSNSLRVVSLNLGARNTNPLEFELKGDSSEVAGEAMAVLRRAGKALRDAQQGPLLMPANEAALVGEILAEIFAAEGGRVDSESHARISELLRCQTWERVLSLVKARQVHFFSALNLHTLELGRPSLWEAPWTCQELTNTVEYLEVWRKWLRDLNRSSQFWREEAPRLAQKRGMDVPTALAGLLVFDVMSLCTGRVAVPISGEEESISDETREVPFTALARFASQLPASSLEARHSAALDFVEGSHVILAQEARTFAEHPAVVEGFEPPVLAHDGGTAVLLRRGSFAEAEDVTEAVARRMEALADPEAPPEVQKAWSGTARRLAAACCLCQPQLGGFRACFVSLHCCKSECLAAFLERLREVLSDYDADMYVVGMDSNCPGREATGFQKRLCNAGFHIGGTPKRQQVTVAKQRTAFQAQVQKIGEVDVSHKDYVVSWSSARVLRGQTSYTPDLRTPYGVEQRTRQCVRLPTTQWPFDHCGVATSFHESCRSKEARQCLRRSRYRILSGLALFLTVLAVLAVARVPRQNPYGEPGTWHSLRMPVASLVGICEAKAPCLDGWLRRGGSCYLATARLPFAEVIGACMQNNATLVSIGSEAENDLVAGSLCPEDEFCYIGLLSGREGQQWMSGEAVAFSRLAAVKDSPVPLVRGLGPEFQATVFSNLAGQVSGCDPRFLVDAGQDPKGGYSELFLPIATVLVSGGLLVSRRPANQHLAGACLFVSFLINSLWLAPTVYTACFLEDVGWRHILLHTLARSLEASGHSLVAMMTLWLIIRRVSICRSVRALKIIYAATVVPFVWAVIVTSVVLDPIVLAGSGAVAGFFQFSLYTACCWVSGLYVVACVLVSLSLYDVWSFLHREASSGRSAVGGAALAGSVRDARAHFFIVGVTLLLSACRWGVMMAILVVVVLPPEKQLRLANGIAFLHTLATFSASIATDVCGHALAVLNIDAGVVRAKGISAEVVERARREVEQHRVAVRMLKAAPTSADQLRQLAHLEREARASLETEQEKGSWLILQSAIQVETVRIHRLMWCVCVREMSMPVRYSYLIDVPAMEGAPRQHVPAKFAAGEHSADAAMDYFHWLHAESGGAQETLFRQVTRLLAKFNSTPWPAALGLAREEFPWTIWASGPKSVQSRRLQKSDDISPGDILIHHPRIGSLVPLKSTRCVVLEESPSGRRVTVRRSGTGHVGEVPRSEMQTCNGGGAVFVPGPLKKRSRCLDKISADYEGSVPWPAAASLVDVCRCMILVDDPYALAVLVAYVRRNMRVLRVKNRFAEDLLERRSPEELQAMFRASAEMSETSTSISYGASQTSRYRDVAMNVEVVTPNGVPIIAEIQVTLSNLAVLKRAEQKLYTLRRMRSPAELRGAFVFDDGGDAEAGCPGGGQAAATLEGGHGTAPTS